MASSFSQSFDCGNCLLCLSIGLRVFGLLVTWVNRYSLAKVLNSEPLYCGPLSDMTGSGVPWQLNTSMRAATTTESILRWATSKTCKTYITYSPITPEEPCMGVMSKVFSVLPYAVCMFCSLTSDWLWCLLWRLWRISHLMSLGITILWPLRRLSFQGQTEAGQLRGENISFWPLSLLVSD